MSYSTKTLTQLRTELASYLYMPFFEYFGSSGSTITTKTDTTTFIDTALIGLPDDYYNGAWLLVTSGDDVDEIRRIIDFTGATGSFDVHAALPNLAATHTYEIWSGFSPHIMTQIINRVISEAFPEFTEAKFNEELIVERDKMTYDLTSLTDDIGFLNGIWLERPSTVIRGTATAGAATTFDMPTGVDLSNVDSNWKVSIPKGTGSGQLRNIASVSSQQVTISAAWTTNPNTTSEMFLWDASKETNRWEKFPFYGLDTPQNPSNLVLRLSRNDVEGHRFRLSIIVPAGALTASSDTTVVPQEYIINQGLAFVHQKLMDRNRTARGHHERQHLIYSQIAADYKAANSFKPPAYQMQRDPEFSGRNIYVSTSDGNPLGW